MPQRSKPNKPTIGEIKPPYGPTMPPGPAGPTAPPIAPTGPVAPPAGPVAPYQPPARSPDDITIDALDLAYLIETMPPGSGLQHNPNGSTVTWVYMTHIRHHGRPRPRAFYADTPLDTLRQAVEEQKWANYQSTKVAL